MNHDLLAHAPKVLLHDHLDGGLRPATVVELAREHGYTSLPSTDPDELVVEAEATGTYTPNGAGYENRYVIVYGFRDGRICRQREYYNPLAAQRSTAG